jgi:hypothetical protein
VAAAKLARPVPAEAGRHRLSQAGAQRPAVGEVELDPIFEAKCLPFLEAGDLFWLIAIR